MRSILAALVLGTSILAGTAAFAGDINGDGAAGRLAVSQATVEVAVAEQTEPAALAGNEKPLPVWIQQRQDNMEH